MIKMTIHHGEEVQQRDLPCDFLSLRMSLYQMNLMLAPNEVSVRDVQAEFTSTDPIGQKLISLIRPGDLLSDVDVAIHQLKAAPQAIQEAMRQRLLDGAFETIEDIHIGRDQLLEEKCGFRQLYYFPLACSTEDEDGELFENDSVDLSLYSEDIQDAIERDQARDIDTMAMFFWTHDQKVNDAVCLMLAMNCGIAVPSYTSYPAEEFRLPEKNDNMRRVYAYLLRQRGIDKDVLDAFSYRGLIYESAKYHNVVFVGKDKEKKPRHAHKRGSGSQSTYKGNAPGSLPGYSFHWVGASDTLYLFEAPVDLLSYISMNKSGWRNHSYAASCSVSDKVLWQMLHDYPYIKRVRICFDSDKAGQEAAMKIAEKLKSQNIEYEILVPVRKDWNEDLLHGKEDST